MAEARSIANLSEDLTANNNDIQLYSQDGGLQLRLQLSIPPPKRAARNIKRFLYRRRNMVVNMLYPFGLLAAMLLMFGMTVYVLYFQEDDCKSIWCLGWIFTAVWQVLQWMPFMGWVPRQLKLVYAACIAGFLAAVLFAAIQRYLLRGALWYKGWMYAERGKRNLHIKLWGLIVKVLSGRSPMLYSFQGSLPRLPVPSARDTVTRYLESMRPVLEPEAYARTEELAEEFLSKESFRLQTYLTLKSWWSTNYVSDWWERYVYLRGRSSLMINSNYYITDTAWVKHTDNQVARAACMISEILEFKRLLEHEEIEPIKIQNIVPLCMSQYRRMFNTTRIPGLEEDRLEHNDDSKHIVVFCRGNYYSLPLFTRSGRVLTACEIEDQLLLIRADAIASDRTDSPQGRVHHLTAQGRTRWAEARSAYLSFGQNKRSLRAIESAMFHVVLDAATPETWTEMGNLNIHGGSNLCWFDKSFSLIVYENGHIGANVEHSWADALVVAHLWEIVLLTGESLGGRYNEHGLNIRDPSVARSAKSFSLKLQFEIPAGLETAIDEATAHARGMIEDLDLQIVQQSTYGKSTIKTFKMSPDAFVQAMLQYAYWKDAGKTALTYESASVRLFRNGRTETIRSATNEAASFVATMINPQATKEEKRSALRRSCEKHSLLTRAAMSGNGIDRHLFALYVTSLGVGAESEFLKEAISQPWTLSTSQQPIKQTNRWNPDKIPEDYNRMCPGGGFGPVSQTGYGVSYLVTSESIFFHISSKHSATETDTERFKSYLLEAFTEAAALFDE